MVVCGVVCGGLWWFVVVCGGLWCLVPPLYIYSCFIPRGIKQEYIYSDDIEETLPCLAREVFPGRGFSWGGLKCKKMGLGNVLGEVS